MILRFAAIGLFLCVATQTGAAELYESLRPAPRPTLLEPSGTGTPSTNGFVRVDPSVPGVALSLRPIPRPGSNRIIEEVLSSNVGAGQAVPSSVPRAAPGLFVSLRPAARPARQAAQRPTQEAVVRSAQSRVEESPKEPRQRTEVGLICGQRSIRGEVIAPITGSLRGCGVSNPVRVHEVDGVRLSQPSIMTCQTAHALHDWVKDGIRPAIRRLGGGISQLQVAAHYTCRTRNNRTGEKISEHGRGNAIDISGFKLENDRVISVESGWNDRVEGNVLRRLHGAGCGPFSTVLGPASDRHHRDHFHLDITRQQGGRYCR